MRKLKIGLLPLYIKLYDDFSYSYHAGMQAYYDEIAAALEERGLDVCRAPICRLQPEFREAVDSFEKEDVDALVTLNLAYSPSLESAGVLASTNLPIVVLDTTRDEVFDAESSPDLLMYNHGIHGVQDLCNLLLRNGKPFALASGFWKYGKVLDDTVRYVRAAAAAKAFRRQRVGIVGEPFRGMGDFTVTPEEFARLGVTIRRMDVSSYPERMRAVPQEELDLEAGRDADTARVLCSRALQDQVNRSCLALRRWIEEEKLTAFTVSFLATSADTVSKMPFPEACREMREGIGYAGEGDLLTAALVGALLSCYPKTTFAEMFCPDWKHNTIFLSHMGEFNLRIAKEGVRMCEMPFRYTSAGTTAAYYGTFGPGAATLCTLAPLGGGRFRLILAPVDMLDVPADNSQRDSVNGWFRPGLPVDAFLKAYSLAGGTHHSALCYGVSPEELRVFADALGFETIEIG